MGEMQRVEVVPAIAMLAYSIEVPKEFHQVPVPAEQVDFSAPTAVMPIGVFMAGYGAVLCTVSARPAFEEGSVMDWVMYLVGQQEGFQVKKMMPETRWGTSVVEVEATQPGDMGEMQVRARFFEDGGRFYNVMILGPTAVWPSVVGQMTEVMESFALKEVKGPTKPTVPGGPVPKAAVFGKAAGAAPAVEAPKAKPQPPVLKKKEEEAEVVPDPAEAEVPAPSTGYEAEPEVPDMSTYALEDAGALDPEDETNARIRDNGVGLVPRVLATDEAKKAAVIGSGALSAMMPVPLGWHVIDDGGRTLVFDTQERAGNVQVNLNLFTLEPGSTPGQVFTEIFGDVSQNSPEAQHREFESDGFNVMQVRDIVLEGGEKVEQLYMIRPHPAREGSGLKIRITAPTEQVLFKAAEMAVRMCAGARWIA